MRGHLVRFLLLNRVRNNAVANVNYIGYSKNVRNKDNPQPSPYVHYGKDMGKVQRLNGGGGDEVDRLK